eukprot:1084068-Prorocentrum_minimum.AAC.1
MGMGNDGDVKGKRVDVEGERDGDVEGERDGDVEGERDGDVKGERDVDVKGKRADVKHAGCGSRAHSASQTPFSFRRAAGSMRRFCRFCTSQKAAD